MLKLKGICKKIKKKTGTPPVPGPKVIFRVKIVLENTFFMVYMYIFGF